MFPDIGPADVALALSDAGDQIEAAVRHCHSCTPMDDCLPFLGRRLCSAMQLFG